MFFFHLPNLLAFDGENEVRSAAVAAGQRILRNRHLDVVNGRAPRFCDCGRNLAPPLCADSA